MTTIYEVDQLLMPYERRRSTLFTPSFEFRSGPFELLRNCLLIGQHCLIFGRENLVRQVVERVMRFSRPLLCAQDQANRRVFSRLHSVLTGIVQIEMHLPCIGIAEAPHLQVDDDEASQAPVEKDEVNPKPGIVDS